MTSKVDPKDFNKQVAANSYSTLRTSIPHNLPSLQPFFGREQELLIIADAIGRESCTWGIVIDGPGGMGKTSLAVRAAYSVRPEDFDKIAFVSLKSRELDYDRVIDRSGSLITGLAELINKLAGELGYTEIPNAVEDQRTQMLLDALCGTRTLLVLDNLESLLRPERDKVLTFVRNLPQGCRAILTSRDPMGSGAEALTLVKLDEAAALKTIETLAEYKPALKNASQDEWKKLCTETLGRPLLLRWVVDQIGRGSCLTCSDAINYLRSCTEGNDPLEFIFGDLVANFSDIETRVVCLLTYFMLPAKVEHIGLVLESGKKAQKDSADFREIETTLKSLTNRSLVVSSGDFKAFTLIPLVAEFLRKKMPGIVAITSKWLENYAHALIMENGQKHYERFPVLDAAWPVIAAALPLFLLGPDEKLQPLCGAIWRFLDNTGRLDEWLALSLDAEKHAIEAKNFFSAGWRAYHAGRVYNIRAQSAEILKCADRAEAHWHKVKDNAEELPYAIRLRGLGYKHEDKRDLSLAIAFVNQALDLWRALKPESEGVVIGLNDRADAKRLFGDLAGADTDYREAIRIANVVDYREGVVNSNGNFVEVFIDRRDWKNAELQASDALSLAERFGRQHAIGGDCHLLSFALLRQGKAGEALPYARRAVEILTKLGSRYLARARQTLAECELLIENHKLVISTKPRRHKMPKTKTYTHLSVVLASPNDVKEEREAMPEIIAEINRGVAADRNLHLELIRWETDAYPSFHPDGPQGAIDGRLKIEDSDLLIGIFWHHFGKPTKDADSGTQHEFLLAYETWKKNGHPQIMMYFNKKPYSPTVEEVHQWAKVLQFKKDFPSQGLWWEYEGLEDFKNRVRQHLTQYVRDWKS